MDSKVKLHFYMLYRHLAHCLGIYSFIHIWRGAYRRFYISVRCMTLHMHKNISWVCTMYLKNQDIYIYSNSTSFTADAVKFLFKQLSLISAKYISIFTERERAPNIWVHSNIHNSLDYTILQMEWLWNWTGSASQNLE